jgi:hypothetical protein
MLLLLLPLSLAPSFVLGIAPTTAPFPAGHWCQCHWGLHVHVHPPFLLCFCLFMHVCACLWALGLICAPSLHLFAHSCPLLSPSPSCCHCPHRSSHSIGIKNMVSVHSVVILLTFKTNTIHLNIKN